ncbi:hypothetical protein F4782DRAFT_533162 [Xylaria castorea]|nr:hypothetical protein F4782DRAFT_533162 [Xylaria castorea]
MAQPNEAHSVGVERASEVMEVEAIEAEINTEPEHEDYLSDMVAAQTNPVQAETIESKAPEPKVKNRKSIPFNPAKIKAAAAAAKSKRDRPVGANTAGKKPTGVRKSRGTRPPKQHHKKGDTPSLDDMLSKARKWIVAPTSYMMRNPETRCFGLSVRRPEAERSEITIAHTVGCGCLDVGLSHIARHVDGLVKTRRLARRSRDAFVIATKIRRGLPHPIPRAVRFPTIGLGGEEEQEVIRRPRAEVEAEAETAVIDVVDVHRRQKLVEKWKSLKAYNERPIWKDW